MQQVTLSLLVLLAGLPALAANDPEDKDSPFYYDWHSLRVGGLICAGILCAVGIIVLMSGKCKCKFNQKPSHRRGTSHLLSLQALPMTIEDGSAKRAWRPLSVSPGPAQEPRLQNEIPLFLRLPCRASLAAVTGGVSVQFLNENDLACCPSSLETPYMKTGVGFWGSGEGGYVLGAAEKLEAESLYWGKALRP